MKGVIVLVLLLCCVHKAISFSDTFVVNCAPLTQQRSDPIVSPGIASGHVHAIIGGNAFSRNMSSINASTNANATTCDKKLDHSNYWVPQLYHGRSDGTFELVPWIGSAIYYQTRACDYTTSSQYCNKSVVPLAFPYGFRMVAGDTNRRTYNDSDFSQRAVNMMCMNDDTSIQYQGFPPTHCKTLRAEVYFPSCWDGKNLDSSNHKSHVAYPEVGNFDGGVCPKSHPVAILSIFYEFFFDTSSYTDTNRFVFANGDTTGYGFHGDFIMGWTDRQALQTAHQTCLGPTDAQCPINTAGAAPGQNVQGPQPLMYPAVYEEDIGLRGNPISQLPGNNPVNWTDSRTPRAKIIAPNGKYVQSPSSSSPLSASATLSSASIFQILTSGNLLTFRNEADGLYVSAENGGASPLIASRSGAQGWEMFTMSPQTDGTYTITAQANSQLVQLQADASLKASGGTTKTVLTSFTFQWL